MIAKMKIGPKGQVVIPKLIRDDFGLKPGGEVIVDYNGRDVVIRKTASNIAEIARAIAMSGRKVKVTAELLKKLDEEEFDERNERLSRR
ncbi:AbrB/MazE/SpoVT family DNA-binding domain-containing protein [Candidatus Woesearchaeota archaeon]|nr:AbrB/MazE/SpoVT family DNA-binding domain-containing protein [Candidatus Woesearchaeota archaeon]